MDHFCDEKIQTLEDEIEIIQRMSNGSNRVVSLEDIRFKISEQQFVEDFKQFNEYIEPLLTSNSFVMIRTFTSDFLREKIDAETLFYYFHQVFGPILVFKYFYLYTGTVINKSNLKKRLEDTLQFNLNKVGFRYRNFIVNARTWENYFEEIKNLIRPEIMWRIESKKINIKQKYLIEKERLFQLVGSIKKSNFQELIHWKYLNNFLREVECKTWLQKALLVPEDKANNLISKFSSLDLLVCYTYFDLLMQKLDGKDRGFNYEYSSNQNLLKRFMKANPKDSNSLNYECKSEKEDYPEVVESEKSKNGQNDALGFQRTARPFKEFIVDDKDVNAKNEFKKVIKSNNVAPQIFYENTGIIERKIEESFPALESEGNSESIFNRMNAQKKSILKTKHQQKQPSKTTQLDKPIFESKKVEKKKERNFVFKNEILEEQDQREMARDIDIESDFPALPSDENVQIKRVKFENNPTKVVHRNVSPKYIGAISLETDFPEMEVVKEEDSIFARMNNSKKMVIEKKKQKKSEKPIKKSRIDDMDFRKEEIGSRKKKHEGKIQVDYDFYFDQNRKQEPEPIDEPPPEELQVVMPKKNPAKCDFPTIDDRPDEGTNVLSRMNAKKQNKMEELSQKFGYSSSTGSKKEDVEIAKGGTQKRKKKGVQII